MIELRSGNILKADVEALINTVNTQGMMGKGIALQFRKAYPTMFAAYQKACRHGELQIGKMHVFDLGDLFNPRYIINFPTKDDWRQPSRLEYIESGLKALVQEIRVRKIRSIAVPPLGSGLGGLNWESVLPRIQQALGQLSDVSVLIYEPTYQPKPSETISRTRRPAMNHTRATVLQLLRSYCVLGYELTLLEVQKLLYFLQEAGEPLKLRFFKKTYGPYADNVRHVLHQFEDHFTTGFSEGKNRPDTPIQLMPSAVEEAERFLETDANLESVNRLARVKRLIEGFESPYGMELLASVHWVVCYGTKSTTPTDIEGVTRAIHSWNDRKRILMKSDHIEVAWHRLRDEQWLEA